MLEDPEPKMSSGSNGGSSKKRNGRAQHPPPLSKFHTNADAVAETSPLLGHGTMTLNYNSDSAVYDLEARDRTWCLVLWIRIWQLFG